MGDPCRKVEGQVDFTATAARVYPSAQNAASTDFSGGPFIIPTGYETIALQVIQQFRNERPPNNNGDAQAQDVAVYQTTTSTTGSISDIRSPISRRSLSDKIRVSHRVFTKSFTISP